MTELKKQIERIKTNKDLRIQIPSLMRSTFKLFDFQHPAVAMMYIVPRMILGYDVGLGKSAIMITTFALIKEKRNFNGTLYVVTPRSALYQWKGEVEKFSTLSATVIDAQFMDQDERAHYYQNDWGKHDVVISTYSLMYRDLLYLEPHLPNTIASFDEVVTLKSREAKVYKTAGKVFAARCPRIYGLSATILKNNLVEPYNIYSLIVPGSMPSYKKFEELYCVMSERRIGARRTVKVIEGHTNVKQFYDLIAPYYISCKKTEVSVESLPQVVIKPIYLQMHARQKDYYLQVLSELLETEERTEEITSIFKKLIRCQQVSDSPAILGMKGTSSKEEELLRLLEEEIPQDEKVVIFSKFKQGVYRLEEVLKKYEPLTITGDAKGTKRDDVKNLYTQDASKRVIIINTAAREAINLQISGNLIFYNLDWSYGNNLQIIGRINRLGSDHKFNHVYIMMNKFTIDEYVYHTVIKKEAYFEELLGGVGYEMDVTGLRNFVNNFTKFSKQLV